MGWDGIDFGRSQMGLGSDSDFHPNPEWDWDCCRGINPKSGSRKIPNIFYDHFWQILSLEVNFGSGGHFVPIFSLWVILGQFRVCGSLWANSGFGYHFGPISGPGVTLGQFGVWGSFWGNFESEGLFLPIFGPEFLLCRFCV